MTARFRYEPGPTADVDLSDNTSPWGTPPAAQAALQAAARTSMSRYPSPYGERLKAAAAQYLGVTTGQVVTGCGSDDVLDAAIRSAAAPGQRLAFCAPTFSMIPALGQVHRLELVAVPFLEDWQIDVERLLAADAAVTFICAPNNPTATGVSRVAVEAVLERTRGLVIVDEAYGEYSGTSVVDLVDRHDRLLVVRTLSKAFGLAALRIGYAAGAPALIRNIEGARGPFKVTSASEAAGVAALTEDRAWVQQRVAETLALRGRFEAAVAEIGTWMMPPSQANFVLAWALPDSADSAMALDDRLRARGIAGRLFRSLSGIGDALRITIGPWGQLAPVVDEMARGSGS